MIDREEVIGELKEGIDFAYHRCHCGLAVTMEKALALLKAQEPVRPYLDFDGKDVWTCGNCNRHLFHLSYTQCDDDEKAFHKYCGYCGRAVKWYA